MVCPNSSRDADREKGSGPHDEQSRSASMAQDLIVIERLRAGGQLVSMTDGRDAVSVSVRMNKETFESILAGIQKPASTVDSNARHQAMEALRQAVIPELQNLARAVVAEGAELDMKDMIVLNGTIRAQIPVEEYERIVGSLRRRGILIHINRQVRPEELMD